MNTELYDRLKINGNISFVDFYRPGKRCIRNDWCIPNRSACLSPSSRKMERTK
ncbi:hypothetical protein NXV73_26070 [Bacteroides salyersiae]|nr:hypothetical protein [Bacteroides salyersiae]